MPTFFGRDIIKCREFAEAWYGEKIDQNEVPVGSCFIVHAGVDLANRLLSCRLRLS